MAQSVLAYASNVPLRIVSENAVKILRLQWLKWCDIYNYV